MKPTRIVANLVGFMLFVQVILGGLATVLSYPVIYHLVWGVLTFSVLVIATVLAVRAYGSKSTLFKVGIAATADFVVQGILGLIALGSDPAIVIHLTNAFVLAVFVTYFISFADSAEKMPTALNPPGLSATSGTMQVLPREP